MEHGGLAAEEEAVGAVAEQAPVADGAADVVGEVAVGVAAVGIGPDEHLEELVGAAAGDGPAADGVGEEEVVEIVLGGHPGVDSAVGAVGIAVVAFVAAVATKKKE